MATSPTAQNTDFTRDVLGRYTCNGLDEARPDVNPFDVIVIGGGSFGPIFAQHLLYRDPTRARRTLVLEAGRFVLPEHVQNLPMLGLSVPPAISVDLGVRAPRSGACPGSQTCQAASPVWPTASAAVPSTSAAGRRSSSPLSCRRRGLLPSSPSSMALCRAARSGTSVRRPSRSAPM